MPDHNRFSRTGWSAIWPVTILVLALVGMLTAWRIHDDYRTTLDQAAASLKSTARIADEQISGALRAIDLLMMDVGVEWEKYVGGEKTDLEHYIRVRMLGLPEVRVVGIFNPKGILTVCNMPSLVGDNAIGREQFEVPRSATDKSKMFIFPPVLSPIGTVVIVVARAVTDKAGKFLGVVAPTISPRYFQDVLFSVAPNKNSSISLANRQGHILARIPDQDGLLKLNISKERYFQKHLASNERSTVYRGLVGGNNAHMVLVHRLNVPSLFVIAQKPMDEILASWKKRFLVQFLVYLAIAFIAVFLVVVAQRRQKRILAAEQSLAQALALNRSIVSQAQLGMALFKSDGTFLLANQALAHFTGTTAKDGNAQNLNQDPFWRDTGLLDAGLEVLATGQTREMETQTGQGEQRRWSYWTISRIVHQGQVHLLIMAKDITHIKKAEDHTHNLEIQLRQSQKMEALGTLASGMAHDFNNSLSAIMGFSELAQLETRKGQDCSKELVHIYKAAERATDLVRQIMTFSRKVESNLKSINLNAEVRRAVEVLERTIPKMIAIKTDLAEDLQKVEADANQIEQVLINLANNASDAMPEGGVLEFFTQNTYLDDEYLLKHLEVGEGEYVILQVSDTGQGMDEATREKMFHPFFTTKAEGKGTGLGLATVYGIVKSHGGHIHCYSELGMGTTFKIYLPIHKDKKEIKEAAAQEIQEIRGGSETIMLVDDEKPLLEVGVRLLSGKGYAVITAESGEEGLEKYRALRDQIKLVILDLNMPGMGGYKCLKQILALTPQAKVIIVSGYASKQQQESSLESGALEFVAKPYRRSDLLTTVRRVLDAN